jgi:general secretion pathway protein D
MALSATLACAGIAEAAKEPPSGWITLNFVNADINAVINAMSDMTGRTFVVDPRVKGTINITSPRPVAPSVAYEILLAALRMQGFAAVQTDGVVRILPEVDAKFYAAPTIAKTRRGKVGGEMMTRVFPLRHESAAQLLAALRPLVGASGAINADPSTNTLLVTDYADNLGRLEQIIENLDAPSPDQPVLIPLKYASAQEVSDLITRVFVPTTGQGAAGGVFDLLQVGVDNRSNSLIVRGRDRSLIGKVQNLAASLDVPTPVAGNVHVIYLKNAQAVEVAKTLRNILTADTAALGQAQAQVQAQVPGAQPAKASPSQESGPGMIQADAASNALIITAPEAIFNNLKAVVEKLDVRRAQVLVEALIVEMTANKAAELGIQWLFLDGVEDGDTSFLGGFGTSSVSDNIATVAANPVLAAQGLNLGVVKGTITLPGIGEIANLGFLARALETNANANILSTPTLLTLDNEEAEISVGSNVPFQTGQYNVEGTANPFTTVERRDVGLILRVKPQISEGGTVRLRIYQEVSKLRPSLDPTLAQTDKRSIDSIVLVDDGQIVVLGGLIEDTVNDTVDKVPVLGDIPLLGRLFRYDSREHVKTNLMVFLRPVIVRDAAAAAAVTHPRYDYILGQQKAAAPAHRPPLPDVPAPMLRYDMGLGGPIPAQDKPQPTP